MDKNLFSNRLADLRKTRGFKTQYALAKAYNEKFPPKRRDDTSGSEGDFSGILGTIKNYENPNKSLSPKLSIVCNLCEILDCDIDYLLGNIDVPRHETADIMASTGLSEESVDTIRTLRCNNQIDWGLDTLNFMLQSTNIEDFLYFMTSFSISGETTIESHPVRIKKKDIFQMKMNDEIKLIADNLAHFNKGKPDYRHLYGAYLGAYLSGKDKAGRYHSIEKFKEEMEQNGLVFDPFLFEGRNRNG